MWLEYLRALNVDFKFNLPATEKLIQSLELTLKFELPADLKALLSETNGISINRTYNDVELEESVIHSWAEIDWWDAHTPPEYQPENMSKFLLIGGNYGIDFAYELKPNGEFLEHIVLCDSDDFTQPRLVFQSLKEYIEAIASGQDTF